MKMLFLFCILLALFRFGLNQQQASIPIRLPSVITSNDDSTCPLQDFSSQNSVLEDTIKNYYRYNRPCSCGGPGWTRVAYLNMSDPDQQCPSKWNLITTPVRACGRQNENAHVCDSVTYSVDNLAYSSVCGKIIAIQMGVASAFYPAISYNTNIENAYLSGISLTHGSPREHIYTFAAANVQQSPVYNPLLNCACTNTDETWPYQLPSFIGNDYFCETGNPGPEIRNFTAYYTEDPLWDGAGCDSSSTCCELNNPPWFCKALMESTSDDLEIRLCNAISGADILITFIDIYMK